MSLTVGVIVLIITCALNLGWVWDKPMANGLSSNPDLFALGDSLLSSIGTLGNLMSLSSLSPNSLANFQSFVDAMTGNGMTPDADVMARLRELYDRLKSGPLSVHGILEYEVCVCKGKKGKRTYKKKMRS